MDEFSASGSGPVKVLLVDDQALFSAMLKDRLVADNRIEVVAQASCGEEAFDLAVAHRPDVILLDIEMPGMLCFDAARRILDRLPATRVVFLSAFPHDYYIDQALSLSARGFLTKQETPQRVIDAVLRAHAGELCFSQDVLGRIVIDHRGPRLANNRSASISALTPREIDVLRLIAMGFSKRRSPPT